MVRFVMINYVLALEMWTTVPCGKRCKQSHAKVHVGCNSLRSLQRVTAYKSR